jgi:hypothetical protein
MKKLIVLSVVFALVASTAAFAVDLGATIIGSASLASGESGDDASEDIVGSGGLGRVRIDGGGEAGEGKFGGYFRYDGGATGNAWWKPIDQFKLLIGGNGGDGFFAKEGVTGWMFYQEPCDIGVSNNGNTWGGGYGTMKFRDIFYGGGFDGNPDVLLMITPLDILAINVQLPFITGKGMKTEDIFKVALFQLDLKLDFGNIALTYKGGLNDVDTSGKFSGYENDYSSPQIYLYYGGSFGDLAIDFGFTYHMDAENAAGDKEKRPMGVGLGVKYAADSFGVKFRAGATLAGEDKNTNIIADIMPYFSLGDNITAFVSVGIGMFMPDDGDQLMGWHFNPYVQIGEEWGAKFVIGVKLWNQTALNNADTNWANVKDDIIHWEVPIGVKVSF